MRLHQVVVGHVYVVRLGTGYWTVARADTVDETPRSLIRYDYADPEDEEPFAVETPPRRYVTIRPAGSFRYDERVEAEVLREHPEWGAFCHISGARPVPPRFLVANWATIESDARRVIERRRRQAMKDAGRRRNRVARRWAATFGEPPSENESFPDHLLIPVAQAERVLETFRASRRLRG